MLTRMFRRMRAHREAPRDAEGRRGRLRRYGVQPEGWKPGIGYENGVLVEGGGQLLFVAGQIAWTPDQKLVGQGDMAAQFVAALDNVLAVVEAAGGLPQEITRMTVYVTDKKAYLKATRAIGAAWKERLGRHYPAMALVQVADLLEEGAMVEIEATAVIG